MTAILGIDAAWTATQPSGVALLARQDGRWRCRGLAPSYAQFEALADSMPVHWTERPRGELPVLGRLLAASERLLDGKRVSLITVDMPLSLEPIRARRAADSAISRAFGARGCAVHSPSAERPGAIADHLRVEAASLGYPLATALTPVRRQRALLEVYPHPALLHLLRSGYRVPYKAAKRRTYWPDATPNDRLDRLLGTFDEILGALRGEIDDVPITLPARDEVSNAAALKAIEDALDALVCGWVGIQYLTARCQPYGDVSAAIWVPTDDF